VYWYNSESDLKYEVSFQASVDITIRDFLLIAISEFNKYFRAESLSLYFVDDGNQIFELFLPKKSGKPNEDFPRKEMEWGGGREFINILSAFDIKVALKESK